MMGAGSRLARPLQATAIAMTSSAKNNKNNNPSAHRAAAGAGGFAPRMADDDRKRKSGNSGEQGPSTAVITKTKPQTKKPSMYRVLILNDDYTPMEFVVHVLERFFGRDHEAATRIMLHVHHHGLGECGVYTYEVAETKVTQVMDFARKHQHPLQCVMEKK
jgi:ATP-dependent Clp protease adaptor protein ClpS